jgi:hypothetical protein
MALHSFFSSIVQVVCLARALRKNGRRLVDLGALVRGPRFRAILFASFFGKQLSERSGFAMPWRSSAALVSCASCVAPR